MVNDTEKTARTIISGEVKDRENIGVESKPARTSCKDIAQRFGKTIVEPKKKKRPAGW
ncbi:MAG: hypothetical protein U9Q12_02375 [Patescibacteria group bacterium]|nr:hypothetical protein [Patescibacteria group bacterium]